MGCGKSIQALAAVACYEEEWPFLVIAPSSLKMQWAMMIEEWLGFGGAQINVVTSGRANVATGRAVIVSYDLVGRLRD
jgi:SWI/SNF-related matrix-associated actin-dependent regulator 1 of chromatin subfamily A